MRRGIGSATPLKAGEAERTKRVSTSLSLRHQYLNNFLKRRKGMRGQPKNLIILFAVLEILAIIGLENASAQQYFNFVGKVTGLYRDQLTVKGNKGEIMYFAVGRRTVYIPSRLPAVGERVRVSYYLRRGYNVAYQVEILSTK
jgi:hypothetical protein